MVCMESPAVDFKAGIFTGNEHEGDEQTLEEKYNIIHKKYQASKVYITELNKYIDQLEKLVADIPLKDRIIADFTKQIETLKKQNKALEAEKQALMQLTSK